MLFVPPSEKGKGQACWEFNILHFAEKNGTSAFLILPARQYAVKSFLCLAIQQGNALLRQCCCRSYSTLTEPHGARIPPLHICCRRDIKIFCAVRTTEKSNFRGRHTKWRAFQRLRCDLRADFRIPHWQENRESVFYLFFVFCCDCHKFLFLNWGGNDAGVFFPALYCLLEKNSRTGKEK